MEKLTLFLSIPIYRMVISCCVLAVIAILFLQSGLDKIIDRKGNVSWLTSHFSKSPLARITPMLVIIITILEVSTGLAALIAILSHIFYHDILIPRFATILAMLTLICLFFGQRMAKDYAGAASLMGYLVFTVLGMLVLMR